jgi:hypothetical protein
VDIDRFVFLLFFMTQGPPNMKWKIHKPSSVFGSCFNRWQPTIITKPTAGEAGWGTTG